MLNGFFDTLRAAFETEELVVLRGDLGAFDIKEKGGWQSEINYGKEYRNVSFKMSNALKNRLRQSDESYKAVLRAHGKAVGAISTDQS